MVVLFHLDDIESSDEPASLIQRLEGQKLQDSLRKDTAAGAGDAASEASSRQAEARPNPNLNGFSAALSCYPVVCNLAHYLDLNTLHDLARTCRQIRANLLPYRNQLVLRTLRCSREQLAPGEMLGQGLVAAHQVWTNGHGADPLINRITGGKVGRCARDMVAACRNCGIVVCRNCTAKRPSDLLLSGRHRRLCKTCKQVPLYLHTALHPPETPRASPRSSPSRLSRLPTPPHHHVHSLPTPSRAFTSPAFERDPCICPDMMWLCQACGRSLRGNDTAYHRARKWRTRYTSYSGGLGTGIAEGNKSAECGRGSGCFAAKIVEQEEDIDADVLQALELEAEKVAAEGSGRSWKGSSFMAQEIEGIGGVVDGKWKKKMRRLVRIGAVVDEFQEGGEEDDLGLESEITGEARSWCSWCQRVIPSKEDIRETRI